MKEQLLDIYFDLKDLRNGIVSECYSNQNELLDDLIDKIEQLSHADEL